jgi:hypothetical protein
MKVYVVLESNEYTEYDYCGVYATQEKAEERIDEIVKEFPSAKDNLYFQEEEI